MRFQGYLKRMQRFLSPGSRKRQPRKTSLRPKVESLEDRLLLSGSTGGSLLEEGPVVGPIIPPPTSVTAEFDWSMAARFGYHNDGSIIDDNGDGLIDLRNTKDYANPGTFQVTFDAGRSLGVIASYQWTVVEKKDGFSVPIFTFPLTTPTIDFTLAEGLYSAVLTVNGVDGSRATTTQDFRVKDILIVALGDSMASGEGNPEHPAKHDGYVTIGAEWADDWSTNGKEIARQSHRSTKAAAAQAAMQIERDDPHTSVTFIFLAASGSGLSWQKGGMLTSKGGIEDGGVVIPPQVDTLRNLLAKEGSTRRVDALYMSIGANDAGFKDTLKGLVDADPLYDLFSYHYDLADIRKAANQKLDKLPDHFDSLAFALKDGLDIANVYISEYPDPTNRSRGSCSEILGDIVWSLEIDSAEFGLLRRLLRRLNTTIADSASEHGWHLVGGLSEAFHDHGYCASPSNRWFRTATESKDMQGPFDGLVDFMNRANSDGTVHPNELGHNEIKKRLLQAFSFGVSPIIISDDLVVTGTEGSDTINVTQVHVDGVDVIRAEVNGVLQEVALSQLRSIQVLASGGNDIINLDFISPSTPVTVAGGAGNDTVNVGSLARNLDDLPDSLTISGGDGTDVLNVYDQSNPLYDEYAITPTVVARDLAPPVSYDSFETLIVYAGSGNNTITVGGTPDTTAVTVNAGDGNDTINVERVRGPGLTIYAGAGSDTINVSPQVTNLNNIESGIAIDGGAGIDRLNIYDQANSAAQTYGIYSAYVSRSGAGSFTYGNLEALVLNTGSNSDTITVGSTPDATAVTVNAGAGNDTINIERIRGPGLTLSTGAGSDSVNVSPVAKNLNNIESGITIDGGSHAGIDRLTICDQANSAPQTYGIHSTYVSRSGAGSVTYGNLEALVLNTGSSSDTITVAGISASTAVSVNAGTGTDTISGPNAVNTWTLTSNGYGNLNSGALTFTMVEKLNGGSLADTLAGPNLPNFWTLTSNNNGSFNNGAVAFTSMETIHGGSLEDWLTGPNTINTWSLTSNNNGNLNSGALSFTSINTLIGGTLDDTLIGPNLSTSWVIQADNLGYLNSANPFLNPLSFKAVENLTGGTSIDHFVFVGGRMTGAIDGKDGWDTLNFKDSPNGVSIGLTGPGVRDGFDGTSTGDINKGFKNINEVIATNRAVETYLFGPNLASTWDITGYNAGAVTLAGAGNRINFSNVKNLRGGSSDDTFKFKDGAGTILSGSLRGGAGSGVNTLDYSQHSVLNPVTVDLALSRAHRVAGFANEIHNVTGGAGNDTLTGNAADNLLVGGAGNDEIADTYGGYDILLGGAGNDRLRGGVGIGRSIMVGGSGADDLLGTGSDDLLIGGMFAGATPYYSEATGALNRTALNSIMSEWKSAASIDTRIARLETAAPYLLNAATVANDAAVDTLTGAEGSDWIIHSLGDLLSDFLTGLDRKKVI